MRESFETMTRRRKFVLAWLILFGFALCISIIGFSLYVFYYLVGLVGFLIWAVLIIITLAAWGIAVEDG